MSEVKPVQGRLIKWDGEAPTEPEAYERPEAHPACAEVVEVYLDGRPPVVTFKREEN